jgi:hypothetical protein
MSRDFLSPTTGEAHLVHEGAIRLRAGRRKATIRRLTLDSGEEDVLRGRIGKRTLKIALARGEAVSRDGFGTELSIERLKLTGSAARLLNSRLGVDGVFRAGRSLATSSSSTEPATVSLVSGALTLAIDQGTLAKLESLGVVVGPFEAASPVNLNPLTWSFPLIRGGVAPDLSSGSLGAEAGLRLYQDEHFTVMSVLAVGMDLESKFFTGLVTTHVNGQPRYYADQIGTLETTSVAAKVDPPARTFAYSGARVAITQSFADALNESFAKPKGKGTVFSGGEPLGTVGFTAQAL